MLFCELKVMPLKVAEGNVELYRSWDYYIPDLKLSE